MKIERIHLVKPCWMKTDPVEIDQREKIKLWGEVAKVCLSKEIETDMDFFSCLDTQAKKHLS